MATIQRSLLIDAPTQVCYAFWCEFQRYPEFLEDVSRVDVRSDGTMVWDRRANGDTQASTVRLIDQVPDRSLTLQFETGPERGATLTFAPLEGNATWFTFALDYEPNESQGDVAGRLTATSRRLDRELRQAREMIESSAWQRPSQFAERRCD